MEHSALFILLLCTVGVLARPEGPVVPDACILMMPNHQSFLAQTGTPPFNLSSSIIEQGSYKPDTPYALTIEATDAAYQFKGFMIEARLLDGSIELVGTFQSADGKSKELECFNTPASAIGHANNNTVSTVSVLWTAPSAEDAKSIQFLYTVVESFDTFWVMLSSPVVVPEGNTEPPTPEATSNDTSTTGPATDAPNTDAPNTINTLLLKVHGVVMLLAWGLLAPVGITLALFYKVVWPNGEWLYSHLAFMLATLVMSIVGLIIVLIHASSHGWWLNSSIFTLPHQVLGIFVLCAVAINPLLPLCRCSPTSKWRWIFNITHGSLGMIVGQILALCTMLLGLQALAQVTSDESSKEWVHRAIYTMSCIVGLIGMTYTLYNIYGLTYKKHKSSFQEPEDEEGDEDLQPSGDWLYRIGFGIGLAVLLVAFVILTIIFLALS